MTDMICIGAIAGAFGVSGEVRLKSFCTEATDIALYAPLSTKDGSRSFTVTLTHPVAGGLGARLSGVDTKEQADALKESLFRLKFKKSLGVGDTLNDIRREKRTLARVLTLISHEEPRVKGNRAKRKDTE